MDLSKVIKYNGPNYFYLLGLDNAEPITILWNGAVNVFQKKGSILRVSASKTS